MPEKNQQKLAVLIDADNAQPRIIEALFSEIAKYGTASVKRIYGDWTTQQLKGWKEKLIPHAIQPIQQFQYTTGKNSTDSAMIIDAMDLLYQEHLNGFCLVSSDSDFTRLASRIRESGLIVYGFGEKKTPQSFVGACDRFIYVENLQVSEQKDKAGHLSRTELKHNKDLISLLRNAVKSAADESGWAYLGEVGLYIHNKKPDFDPRNYGFEKLYDLVKNIGLFEINEQSRRNTPAKLIYIKMK